MEASAFLEHLNTLDIRIQVAGDRLRIDAPAQTLTDALKDQIRAHKPGIIEVLAPPPDPVPHPEPGSEYPVSFSQHAFFLLDRYIGRPDAYEIMSARRIRAPVMPDLMRAALTDLMERQAGLRTLFRFDARGVYQCIQAAVPPPFHVVDLRSVPGPEQETAVATHLERGAGHRFDLAAGPVFRLTLLRLAPRHCVLILAAHHIVADARSLDIFFAELAAFYLARAPRQPPELARRPPELLPLATSQAAYAARQDHAYRLGRLADHVAFWRRALADPPALLPAMNVVGDGDNLTARSVHRRYTGAGGRRLLSFCKKRKIPRAVVFLAAQVLLLAGYSRLRDIPVIMPVSTREGPEHANLIGVFLHNIVVRRIFSGTESVARFVAETKTALAEALSHQAVPLEMLDHILRREPDADLNLGALSPIALTYISAAGPGYISAAGPGGASPDLDFSPIERDRTTAFFDLMIVVIESGSGFDIRFEYKTALFSPAYVDRMADDFERLLLALMDDPEASIAGLLGEDLAFEPSAAGPGNWPDGAIARLGIDCGRAPMAGIEKTLTAWVAGHDGLRARLVTTPGRGGPRHESTIAPPAEAGAVLAAGLIAQSDAQTETANGGAADPLRSAHAWPGWRMTMAPAPDGRRPRLSLAVNLARIDLPLMLDLATALERRLAGNEGPTGIADRPGRTSEPVPPGSATPCPATVRLPQSLLRGGRVSRTLRLDRRQIGLAEGLAARAGLSPVAALAGLFGLFLELLGDSEAPVGPPATPVADHLAAWRFRAGDEPRDCAALPETAGLSIVHLPRLDPRVDRLSIDTPGVHLTILAAENGYGLIFSGPGALIDGLRAPDRYRYLLEKAAAPGQSIGGVDLLLPEDHARIAAARGARHDPAADGFTPIHERIWAAGANSPDMAAVIDGSGTLSHADLHDAEMKVAGGLMALGIGPGRPVALLLARARAFPIAALACMRAGCPYVPLDPNLPDGRILDMLRRAKAALLITGAELAGRVAGADIPIATLAMLRRATPAPATSTGAGRRRARAGDIVYILFTSGSSGTPKAIPVSHGAIANFIDAMAGQSFSAAGDRGLAVTSFGFDISFLELFLPLCLGGAVVIADENARRNGEELALLLEREAITLMQATPHTWRLLLAAGWRASPGLKALCGGEAMAPALAAALLERCAGLWNMYGPTETTIWSAVHRVTDGDTGAGTIPIGRAIRNTALVVLDPLGRPRPPGVPGELYIGGAGLSPGYLDDGAENARRFVHCTHALPGALGRLYRSGDRVVLDGDNRLCFLGRADRQVKISGHRVELGEIERVARAFGPVEDAVAVVTPGRSGPRLRLVVTTLAGAALDQPSIRRHLRRRLPAYMLPDRIERVGELARLANGKIDLAAPGGLPSGGQAGDDLPVARRPGRADGAVEARIFDIWAAVLEHRDFSVTDNFFDIGGHSLLLVDIQRQIAEGFDRKIPLSELLAAPSVRDQELLITVPETTGKSLPFPVAVRRSLAADAHGPMDIAVIGMAGRFPGARDVTAFWHNIIKGRLATQRLTRAELLADGAEQRLIDHPDYVPVAGVIDNIEGFDAGFFGYSPREAGLIDPQHRALLECAQQALDDAGRDPRRTDIRIGVFAGVGISSYLINCLLTDGDLLRTLSPQEVIYAVEKDYAATRLAYKLNLSGPSLSIGTACSTGLVCIHEAARALLSGDCDMALAGAFKITVPQQRGYLHAAGGITSPDGVCRPFDAGAAGTVFGAGGGVVVLKPLAAATRDHDPIHAVIKGTAVNNDGGAKAGYTAPGETGQAVVIAEALAAADVDPATVSYVETHGTATPLGDPVEISALTRAFGGPRAARGFCALGAVKANIGHLDQAAGIAGFIKTVLALKHKLIPPMANFECPNPALKLADTPFFVPTKPVPWLPLGERRRAGVSAFGIGGANAHVVLEEAPPQPTAPRENGKTGPALIALSAADPAALAEAGRDLADFIATEDAGGLSDIAAIGHRIRAHHRHRRAYLATDRAGLAEALRSEAPPPGNSADGARPALAFVFPGQGAQYPGMAKLVHDREPVFRDAFDACAAAMEGEGRADMHHLVFDCGHDRLKTTAGAQAALFAVEYAYARLLLAWGLAPDVMVGHSLGEITAACVSGMLSLDEAAALVARRGSLMEAAPPGMMAVVFGSREAALDALDIDADIAAVNGPSLVVISGTRRGIAATTARLRDRGIRCRSLDRRHAFHGRLLVAAAARLGADMAHLAPRAPRIPVLSGVAGRTFGQDFMPDAAYWRRQMLATVEFEACGRVLLEPPRTTIVEVGPGNQLGAILATGGGLAPGQACIALAPQLERGGDDHADLLRAVGALWQNNHDLDWPAFDHHRRGAPAHLPAYPFQRRRHWVDRKTPAARDTPVGVPKMARREWLYEPSWQRARLPRPPAPAAGPPGLWVILADTAVPGGLGRAMFRFAREAGLDAVLVTRGRRYARNTADHVRVNPAAPRQMTKLIKLIAARRAGVVRVASFWLKAGGAGGSGRARVFEETAGFLRAWARASGGGRGLRLAVAGTELFRFDRLDRVAAENSLALGPLIVAPREIADCRCAAIDIGALSPSEAAQRIGRELVADLPDRALCYRGGERWISTMTPIREAPVGGAIKPGAVYLITGGRGGIGRSIARYLLARGARVATVSRAPLSDEGTGTGRDGVRDYRADVADRAALKAVVGAIEADLGPLRGVFHAAGIADGRLLAFQTATDSTAVLRPKLDGARVLTEVLDGRTLDFLLLFSSMTAILGAPGQSAYAGANAYLDALAQQHRGSGLHLISVNWEAWTRRGMTARHPELAAAMGESGDDIGLSEEDAWALLDIILANPREQVAVSTLVLDARLKRHAGLHLDGGEAAAPAPSRALASPDIEAELTGLFSRVLGTGVTADDDFFAGGGTSLQVVQLVHHIHDRLDVGLAPGDMLAAPTPAALAKLLRTRMQRPPATAGGPLIELAAPGGPTGTLYLVHPVGGQVLIYRELARRLKAPSRIVGIQSAADMPVERNPTVAIMAARYVAAIRATGETGPIALAGSSFGGTLAYEMARQMAPHGDGPAHLALIDTPGPDDIVAPLRTDSEILAYLAAGAPPDARLSAGHLGRQKKDKIFAYFSRRMAATGGPVADLDETMLRRFVTMFRANQSAMQTYRPPPPAGPITYFLAADRRKGLDPAHPDRFWRSRVPDSKVITIPGDHLSLHDAPHVETFARRLDAMLTGR